MGNPWGRWDDMPSLVDANGMPGGSQVPRTIPPPLGAAIMPSAFGPSPRSAPPSTPQYPWGTPFPKYGPPTFRFTAQLAHTIIVVNPSPTHKPSPTHRLFPTHRPFPIHRPFPTHRPSILRMPSILHMPSTPHKPSPPHRIRMLHGANFLVTELIHSNRGRVHTSHVNPCALRHNHTIILAERTAYQTHNQIPAPRNRILLTYTYHGHRRAIYRP